MYFDPIMFNCMEGLDIEEHIIATYYMRAEMPVEFVKFAQAIAAEQATGTWIDVPFETGDVRKRHAAKVVGMYEVPAYDRELPKDLKFRDFVIKIAFPSINIGNNFPMIFTTLIGNISAGRIKLVDIEFPRKYLAKFKGPSFGVEGLRDYLNIPKRPITLNMIKPDVGWTPEQGGIMAHDAFLGGIDIVKDDELVVGDSDFCPLEKRVKSIMEAAKDAEEKTGEKKMYTPNITDDISRLKDNAYRAIDAGANALMINTYTVGFSAFRFISEDPNIQVPILSHPDYAAAQSYSQDTGTAIYLLWGKLVRMAGADLVVTTNYHGKIPVMKDRYIQSCIQLTMPFADIKPCFPAPGGGLYQGIVPETIEEIGNDVILAAGGAVHGHPDGAVAGGRSFRQAIDAVMEGVSLREYAKEHKELQRAIDAWGISNEKDDLFDMKK
ncbi:MAG: RuBisCO large subunit C-terminal-like domain-containing protein [Eubacteriales bacterium]